jgi:hypothetical protein
MFHPTAKANEMKLQILDEGLDSNREGEKSISFFNELDTGIGTMLETNYVYFLTSLTQEKNYARNLCFIF